MNKRSQKHLAVSNKEIVPISLNSDEVEFSQAIDGLIQEKKSNKHNKVKMRIMHNAILIDDFLETNVTLQKKIQFKLKEFDLEIKDLIKENILVIPKTINKSNKEINLTKTIASVINSFNKKKELGLPILRDYPEKLEFKDINKLSKKFVNFIKKNKKIIMEVLTQYETYEVAKDEIFRTLDLLNNLEENKEFFKRKVGAVTTFLPKNQPLYALSCFTIVPSLMAAEVHVRAPQAMAHFFFDLIKVLKINEFFPNIIVSKQTREDFLNARSEVKLNPANNINEPVTDVVIFTGTMMNADKMRQFFSDRVLFIANGSGHNPLVITEKANINKAIQSTLSVQLYNQGQDCAGPNSILVHEKIYDKFTKKLIYSLKKIKVGPYKDPKNIVGPISERKDLDRIQRIFLENAEWINHLTPGVIHTRSCIVEPTLIERPLAEGGNFIESFAPIFFVQKYKNDDELRLYFEDDRYAPNAMYVTLFGKSKYVDSLIGKKFNGKLLHDKTTIIINKDLHTRGVERGTQQYGGYGRGASCISLLGNIQAKPTLPQRDIYENLIHPILSKKGKKEIYSGGSNPKNKIAKIEKESEEINFDNKNFLIFYDIGNENTKKRFQEFDQTRLSKLLLKPNVDYVLTMTEEAKNRINKLVIALKSKQLSLLDLEKLIYQIPKDKKLTDEQNTLLQRSFFRDLYNLLFAKDRGPRLAAFLYDVDKAKILSLLTL